MAKLRIGTCSWKFPSWVGLVYTTPEGAPQEASAYPEDAPLFQTLIEEERENVPEPIPEQARHLVEYAQQYNTVEIDQWFWSLFGPDSIGLPDPADVTAYRDVVPEDFRFTVKVPNSVTLTHFYQQDRDAPLEPNPYFLSVELFNVFLDRLRPFGQLLGPIMFQFEYLNRQKMPTQDDFQRLFSEFIRQLPRNDLPGGLSYGLEIRNQQYLNATYFDFLATERLLPVLIQGYWMPDVREVYAQWRDALFVHPTVILRLMGPNRQEIEKLAPTGWHTIVLPKDNELPDIAAMIEDLLAHDVDVYVNVNNHYEGSSPLTIAKLRGLLGLSEVYE